MLNPEKYLDEVVFVDFETDREPRCACVLLLDTSNSMKGDKIRRLNEGYKLLINTLRKDGLAALRVELSVITFGDTVKVVQDFTTVDQITAKNLVCDGGTPMGEAITVAVSKVIERKKVYKANGVRYYRPWIFMITDGEPTDAWKNAATLVRNQENDGHFLFFAVGVEGADMHILRQISVREPLALQGLKFVEMFQWLSASLSTVSGANPGSVVQTPEISGWGAVPA